MFEVTPTPTVTVKSDDLTYKVRSDGMGVGHDEPNLYVNAEQCVAVPEGEFIMRTISFAEGCSAQPRGDWRYLTFDLTGVNDANPACAAGEFNLDQDGFCEPLELAPARVSLSKLGNKTQGSTVSIWILELNPDGTTTQNREWRILYQNAVVVPPTAGNGVITLAPGEALADFCFEDDKPSGNRGCPSSGTIDLPFHFTWKPRTFP